MNTQIIINLTTSFNVYKVETSLGAFMEYPKTEKNMYCVQGNICLPVYLKYC